MRVRRGRADYDGTPRYGPGTVTTTATVTSTTADPNPNNNAATAVTTVLGKPRLVATFATQPVAEPEGRGFLDVGIANFGDVDAKNVVLTLQFPADVTNLQVTGGDPLSCDLTASPVICRAPTFPLTHSNDRPTLHFTFTNPAIYDYGGDVKVYASLTSSDPPTIFDYGITSPVSWQIQPFFAVTTTADSGPGSLRDAILRANVITPTCCSLTVIGFRVRDPLPASGYFTIQPQTVLPPIMSGGLLIDGRSEADAIGSNATTPLVMLDGSALQDGDGLMMHSGSWPVKVTGLAIGNFPRFGVFIDRTGGDRLTFDGVYVGVDPTGRTAAPNLRGIVATPTYAALCIVNSVISGNRRSGIVSSSHITVLDSRIGVAADSDAALPNGASGIYLPQFGDVDIERNVIAYNHDPAISIATRGGSAVISRNSIFANGGGIDYGLDGPTANVADDWDRFFPNTPQVTDAHYDAATNKTSITVALTTSSGPPGDVRTIIDIHAEVFANAYGDQAQRYLGDVKNGNTLIVDGDLRGQTITAVTRRFRSDAPPDFESYTVENHTSEISAALPVR